MRNIIFKILAFLISLIIVYMVNININDYILLNSSDNYEMDLEITANYISILIVLLIIIDIGLIAYIYKTPQLKNKKK